MSTQCEVPCCGDVQTDVREGLLNCKMDLGDLDNTFVALLQYDRRVFLSVREYFK